MVRHIGYLNTPGLVRGSGSQVTGHSHRAEGWPCPHARAHAFLSRESMIRHDSMISSYLVSEPEVIKCQVHISQVSGLCRVYVGNFDMAYHTTYFFPLSARARRDGLLV